jgi:hypothetical protein
MESKFLPIFLVGCPRSGTTLLQSMLAAHPDIASFPESHFFAHLLATNRLYRQLNIASANTRVRLEKFCSELEQEQMQHFIPKNAIFTSKYVQAFIKILDTVTEQQDKTMWLEKTPQHLHYIEYIEKILPQAQFIHLIRNGEDVVTSMYEVTHKYPEIWNGARGLDRCIQRWQKDINISRKYIIKPNHILVRYETLVAETQQILQKLCDFFNISFNQKMLHNYQQASKKIRLDNEIWKESVAEKIICDRDRKFDLILNQEQKQYVTKQISQISLPATINI